LSRPTCISVLLIVAAVLSYGCAEEQSVSAVRTPELRAVPAIAEPARTSKTSVSTIEADIAAMPDLKVGSFERPDRARVPEYKILERELADRNGAHAVRLLVDTRARTETDYEIIARDLKARYADYDAISAEFTDSQDILDYNGAAVIFNTPAGVYYIGYIYGPPNNRGYYVRAAD